MNETLTVLRRFNITALALGSPETVDRRKKAGGDAIIPATDLSPEGLSPSKIRKWTKEGRICALAEVGRQYEGIAPNVGSLEPYMAPGGPGPTWMHGQSTDNQIGINRTLLIIRLMLEAAGVELSGLLIRHKVLLPPSEVGRPFIMH